MLGLDLANIKLFKDEIPRIPKSAYFDLTEMDLSDSESESDSEPATTSCHHSGMKIPHISVPHPSSNTYRTLVPMFNQPGSFANFFDLLRSKKVCLENAYMADSSKSIRGTVRVQNLSFSKRVVVRYTTNDWAKSTDLEATYLAGSCDGFSDKFTFCVTVLFALNVGQRFQFCLQFLAEDGQEYWDNNDGRNYVFQCLSQSSGPTPVQVTTGRPSVAPPSVTLSVPVPKTAGASQRTDDPYSTFSANSPSAMSEDPWLRYL